MGSIDLSPVADIYKWRKDVYEAALSVICDESLPLIQKATGVWDWHHGIPLPTRKNAVIIDSGIMNILVKTECGNVLFGIWMFLGEIRIGIRVPKLLLSRGHDLTADLSTCYNGQICQRMHETANHMMFDWIFKDAFADAVFMRESMKDSLALGGLADAIANITTHLYMSAINLIIKHADMVVSPSGDNLKSQETCLKMVIEISGNAIVTNEILRDMGVHIADAFEQEGGRTFLIALVPDLDMAPQIKARLSDSNIDAVIRLTSN